MKIKLLILTVILTIIFSVSCTQEPVQGIESSISETGQVKKVKITANQANITSACDQNSNVLQTANKNNTYDVINKVEDWFAVKLPDNSIGFIPQDQTQPIVPEGAQPDTTQAQTPGEATPAENTPAPGAPAPNKDTADTDVTASSLSNEEQEMLKLVNQARAQNNVPALKADVELANVARIKSKDMIDNNYFSHNSPTYGSPFDMMKQFGVQYLKAGENIAGNQTVAAAHDALMKSPGHRKNILSPDYTHIGIGIVEGGQYGNMFTQMFISK